MFSYGGIVQYQQQLANGEVSCVQAVQHYLSAINKSKNLNAFVDVYSEEAVAQASLLDEQRISGQAPKKLHGVVIAIKDVICYKDHTITAASKMLQGFTSLYTATALQFLIDEEAIIIGNCNCDEFAMGSTNEHSFYGAVKNAADETKVPGGSSGGSAVAVQAGLCMLSLGSDTGGSVRQPAGYCGIIGLKPGYGKISRYGLIAYASSFDQIGIFATHIADIDIVLEIMSQADAKDSTLQIPATSTNNISTAAPDKKYKFAYFPETLAHKGLDAEIKESLKNYIEKLKVEGHVVTAEAFDLLPYIVPAYYVLTTAEASSNLSRYDGVRYGYQSPVPAKNLQDFYTNNRSEGFGKEVKKRIMLGSFVLSAGYFDAYFNQAQKIRRLLIDQVSEIFKNYDAILMPTSPFTAPPIADKNKDPLADYIGDIYTVFANLTGIPAISLPLFSHSNNLPYGLQVLTNRQDEVSLLQISKSLLQHHDAVLQ